MCDVLSTVVPVPDVLLLLLLTLLLPFQLVFLLLPCLPLQVQQEEVDVLSKFLVIEDTSEFDIEPSTKDVATNTSPWKDSEAEVRRLAEVIRI